MSKSHYQGNLFVDPLSSETFVLQREGLDIRYQENWVSAEIADYWFDCLLSEIEWQQDTVTVYGKKHLTPRLSYWMGEHWMSYTYSRNTMQAHPWQDLPLIIKQKIEKATGHQFNSVLINYYRDGQDSNGWHADDEPELGDEPVIASLSLGAVRDFHFRSKRDHSKKHKLCLRNGSLLTMQGATQSQWQHHVPKRASAGSRINLTFRRMVRSS